MQVIDYTIVILSLLFSAFAGYYYGSIKKKSDSLEEYFLASRQLNIIKLATSLFASVLSSGALVGTVAEIYYYGSQPMIGFYGGFLSRVICNLLFLPVFYKIGSYNTYKFYELKFNKKTCYFLSTLSIVETVFVDAVILYGSATVISKITGIEAWILTVTLCCVCTLYSSLGGVRGVTIADVIQGCVIMISIVLVIVFGLIQVGGFEVVWRRNVEGERIEFFNFDVNPTVRHTFWTAAIAQMINHVAAVCTSQTTLMRMMATSSLNKSLKASYLGALLVLLAYLLCQFLGLLIYATYYLCDPLKSGEIQSPNQLISAFVKDSLGGFYGLTGLFYAALLCAAVSTISSHLNSVSALAVETFIKPFNLIKSDQSYTRLAKLTAIVSAALSLACTFIVSRFPTVSQAAIVLTSISNGPHFALLFIGTFFPQAHLKSSLGAFGFGIVMMAWILIGSIVLKSTGITKPLSTVGCDLLNNSTLNNAVSNATQIWRTKQIGNYNYTLANNQKWQSYFPLSLASHNWFTTMGILLTLTTFCLLSFLFGADERPISLDLIPIPFQKLQKKFSKRVRQFLLCDVYDNKVTELTTIQKEKLLSVSE